MGDQSAAKFLSSQGNAERHGQLSMSQARFESTIPVYGPSNNIGFLNHVATKSGLIRGGRDVSHKFGWVSRQGWRNCLPAAYRPRGRFPMVSDWGHRVTSQPPWTRTCSIHFNIILPFIHRSSLLPWLNATLNEVRIANHINFLLRSRKNYEIFDIENPWKNIEPGVC